jgi:hypothetical protein
VGDVIYTIKVTNTSDANSVTINTVSDWEPGGDTFCDAILPETLAPGEFLQCPERTVTVQGREIGEYFKYYATATGTVDNGSAIEDTGGRWVLIIVPPDCNYDGVCQENESCFTCRSDCADWAYSFGTCYDLAACPVYIDRYGKEWRRTGADITVPDLYVKAYGSYCRFDHPDIRTWGIIFYTGWVEFETDANEPRCGPIYSIYHEPELQISSESNWAQVEWRSIGDTNEENTEEAKNFARDLLEKYESRGVPCNEAP